MEQILIFVSLFLVGFVAGRLVKTSSILGYFQKHMTGKIWEKVEADLFDFNKTIITLSSSALVLSFTLVGLDRLKIDHQFLPFSWIFFAFAICLGVFLLFMKFLYRIADEMIQTNTKEGEYKMKSLITFKEIGFYFNSRLLIYWISISELISFLLAIFLLTVTAILSLQ